MFAMTELSGTVVLTREDIRALLGMRDCIDAVEQAFVRHASGRAIAPGVLGVHVDGGVFHVKTAGLLAAASDEQPLFAAKVNANFPGNRDRHGLPTIQGILALFDAANGRLLAVLDSGEVTSIRTAAATAVAARHLARADAARVTVCGCGEQSRNQLRALACVRPVRRAVAVDVDVARASNFAADMTAELGIEIVVGKELGRETRESDIWVTCTTSRHWIVGRDHVAPGSFVAAVGADNPEKQEIEPELLAANAVIADVLDQCAAMGDLHHAIDAGVMGRADVRAELADVVAGAKRGRASPDEIIVFDSTGTALQDVAAAALVYERAVANGGAMIVDFHGRSDRRHAQKAIA